MESGLGTPRVQESTLKMAEIQVERKRLNVLLRENRQGQLVRITEVGARKHCIIVPVAGLDGLCRVLGEMREMAKVESSEAA